MIISQDSRATDDLIIYADIGPNAVNRVQKVVVPDDSNRVQYAEINYSAKTPQNLSVLTASDSMTKAVEYP